MKPMYIEMFQEKETMEIDVEIVEKKGPKKASKRSRDVDMEASIFSFFF